MTHFISSASGAKVEADIVGPEGYIDHLVLQDSGTGYPDITGSDGVYTAYLTRVASTRGHYNVRIHVSDNDGAAVSPRRKGNNNVTKMTKDNTQNR